jgi:hypothetical protein
VYAQAPLLTTIDRLSSECRNSPEQIRAGLFSLIDSGDVRVDRRAACASGGRWRIRRKIAEFEANYLGPPGRGPRFLVAEDYGKVESGRRV